MTIIRLLSIRRKEPYLFWKSLLGFWPKDISLYEQAMRHRSAKSLTQLPHNERLEFVGDALLGIITADLLYQEYPNMSEGQLTQLRSDMVKRANLNEIALQMGLDKLIKTDGSLSVSGDMNGNALEALVGAVYYDRGYETCYRFVERIVYRQKPIAMKYTTVKRDLFEWCKRHGYVVHYDLLDENVAEHHYVVAVKIDGREVSQAGGTTCREAEQRAAAQALKRVRRGKVINKT